MCVLGQVLKGQLYDPEKYQRIRHRRDESAHPRSDPLELTKLGAACERSSNERAEVIFP